MEGFETCCILFVWSSSHSIIIFRSSHPEVFLEKGVLKIRSKFTGEHTCRCVIPARFLCKFIEFSFWHGHSPVNLQHIFRTPFPKNTSGWLLLYPLLRGVDFQRVDLVVIFNKGKQFCSGAIVREGGRQLCGGGNQPGRNFPRGQLPRTTLALSWKFQYIT